MRDVGEGAAVDEGGIVLKGLHQVGLHGVFQQHDHRANAAQIAGINGLAATGVGHNHLAQTALQVGQVG